MKIYIVIDTLDKCEGHITLQWRYMQFDNYDNSQTTYQ